MIFSDLENIVKGKLRITWEDPKTNAEVKSIINNAIVTLTHKLGAGKKIDFSAAGPERELFCNYCMYAYNNCLNEFDEAYANEISQIRIKYKVLSEEDSNG